jgi:hypothetical protein
VNTVNIFGLHKMWRISWPAEIQLASQEGLCSVEGVFMFCVGGCTVLERKQRIVDV